MHDGLVLVGARLEDVQAAAGGVECRYGANAVNCRPSLSRDPARRSGPCRRRKAGRAGSVRRQGRSLAARRGELRAAETTNARRNRHTPTCEYPLGLPTSATLACRCRALRSPRSARGGRFRSLCSRMASNTRASDSRPSRPWPRGSPAPTTAAFGSSAWGVSDDRVENDQGDGSGRALCHLHGQTSLPAATPGGRFRWSAS